MVILTTGLVWKMFFFGIGIGMVIGSAITYERLKRINKFKEKIE